ncbi:MAG: Smr/MutS family protein [Bacteroidetes bacterium]|nr:Smr/MutS family protein [Bacteroidota bacterium]
MLFAIGTRVRFRYTGECGIITAQLDGEMLQVRLDNDPDLEIPAFEEDLMRDEGAEPSSAGAKFIIGKQDKKPEAPPRREIRIPYHILKPKGIQLAFEPMPGRDGTVTRYKAWLINDTQEEFLIELDLYSSKRDVVVTDDKLASATAIELGDLLYDDLNENPELWLRVRRITTEGPDHAIEKTIKIRPKQFFNKLQTAPILNLLAHLFVVIDSFESPVADPGTRDDLKQYTKEKAGKRRSTPESNSKPYHAFNIEEFATFLPEIDLHIENLMNGHARIDKGEILRIQMVHFHRFLDKAIRLGVPKVFVIHGVGEGKLRELIAETLRKMPDVVKFKNEFHHKYGYGATEVILQ